MYDQPQPCKRLDRNKPVRQSVSGEESNQALNVKAVGPEQTGFLLGQYVSGEESNQALNVKAVGPEQTGFLLRQYVSGEESNQALNVKAVGPAGAPGSWRGSCHVPFKRSQKPSLA